MEDKLNTTIDLDSNSSDSCESGYSDFYEFSLPEQCILPDFINTPQKWNDMVYRTSSLKLWSELAAKVDNCMTIPQTDRDTIIKCLAEDVIYIHGLKAFFPMHTCRLCAIKH